MAKAKNMTELRDQMLDVFEDSKKNLIRPADLKEKANLLGKVIQSAKVQLEQSVYLKDNKGVDFLKDE
jgi:hypothetical protein